MFAGLAIVVVIAALLAFCSRKSIDWRVVSQFEIDDLRIAVGEAPAVA
jgi:hypothetical protein